MGRRDRLLPRLRSKNHEWLLRAAYGGGAVVTAMIAAGPLLAATHGKDGPTKLWDFALIAVVAIAVLGGAALLIGGISAFLTRPVRPDHAHAIGASALALERSLKAGNACDYGDSYKPDQAFCAHFPKIGMRLTAWDEQITAPATVRESFDQHIDVLMAEHKMAMPDYNIPEITKYMQMLLVMRHAHGDALTPAHFAWTGHSTAGHSELGAWGTLQPYKDAADWISLTPLDGETEDEWLVRTKPLTNTADAFATAADANIMPYVEALADAEQHLEDFKRDELPAILDALQLVQAREAPRVRLQCKSC
jgi:hypothetical protein